MDNKLQLSLAIERGNTLDKIYNSVINTLENYTGAFNRVANSLNKRLAIDYGTWHNKYTKTDVNNVNATIIKKDYSYSDQKEYSIKIYYPYNRLSSGYGGNIITKTTDTIDFYTVSSVDQMLKSVLAWRNSNIDSIEKLKSNKRNIVKIEARYQKLVEAIEKHNDEVSYTLDNLRIKR